MAILVVDAVEGVTHLDANIGGYAVDAGLLVIICVNNGDALEEKKPIRSNEFERTVRMGMKFLERTDRDDLGAVRQRVAKLLPLVVQANEGRISASQLLLQQIFRGKHLQPKAVRHLLRSRAASSRLKVQYITQGGRRPPLLVLFTSVDVGRIHFLSAIYRNRSAMPLNFLPRRYD